MEFTWSDTSYYGRHISLRAIPNLMILSPATPRQVAACVQTAYEYDGPVYIKIGMNHEKNISRMVMFMMLRKVIA